MNEGYDRMYGDHFASKKADLHIHTNETDGYLTPAQVVDLAEALQLDAIAVTDHNTMLPAITAWNYGQKKNYSIEVIVGTEIDTQEGHILGLFVPSESHEAMPRRINGKMTPPPVAEAIQMIHSEGGLVVVPHPGFRGERSLELNKILDLKSQNSAIDGFELFNAGVAFRDYHKTLKGRAPQQSNERAQRFYENFGHNLGAPIGSTDSHFNAIGVGITGYEGDLKQSIKNAKTIVLQAKQDKIQQILKTSEGMFGELKTDRKSMLEIRRLQANVDNMLK